MIHTNKLLFSILIAFNSILWLNKRNWTTEHSSSSFFFSQPDRTLIPTKDKIISYRWNLSILPFVYFEARIKFVWTVSYKLEEQDSKVRGITWTSLAQGRLPHFPWLNCTVKTLGSFGSIDRWLGTFLGY